MSITGVDLNGRKDVVLFVQRKGKSKGGAGVSLIIDEHLVCSEYYGCSNITVNRGLST